MASGCIATTTTGLFDDYSGPVEFLQHEHISTGNDPVILVAQASNAWLKTGSGDDALAVQNGDNVLDGGSGSNWLVGGAGHDTFYVDARGGQTVWDTVLNFHTGDSLTMWGFQQGVSSWNWTANSEGAAGYTGATLRGALDGVDTDFSVTLANVSATQKTNFSVTTGTTTDGVGYLHIQTAAGMFAFGIDSWLGWEPAKSYLRGRSGWLKMAHR